MEKHEIEDTLRIVRDYLCLMWCIHENYEGLTIDELNQYKLGIQTFLQLAKDEVNEALNHLTSR